MKKPTEWFPASWPKAARIGALTASGLAVSYLAYVGLASLFIATGGVGSVTKNFGDVKLAAGSGYSLWPGHFVVHDLDLRAKNHHMELQVLAEEVEGDLGLLAGLQGVIRFEWIDAKVDSFRVVHRVEDADRHRERLSAFPEIPGFDRPLEYDSKPKKGKKPLNLEIASLRARLREAWFMEYRITGDIDAAGGFRLGDKVEVSDGWARFDASTVFIGETQVAHDASGFISGKLAPFQRSNGGPLGALRALTLRVDSSGRLDSLRMAELYASMVKPGKDLSLDGSGEWRSSVSLESGRLQDASATLHLSTATAGIGDWTERVEVGTQLTSRDGGKRLTITGDVHGLDGSSLDSLGAVVHLQQRELWDLSPTRMVARLQGLDWSSLAKAAVASSSGAPGEDEKGRMTTIEASLPEAGTTDALFSVKKQNESYVLAGQVQARDLRFTWKNVHAIATGSTNYRCAGTRSRIECSQAEADFSELMLGRKQNSGTTWLQAEAKPLTIRPKDKEFRGTLHFASGTPKSVVQALSTSWLSKLGLGLVPMDTTRGTLHLALEKGTLVGRLSELESGAIDARGRFVVAHHFEGSWLVELPITNWGLETGESSVEVHAAVGGDWLQSKEADISEDGTP